MLPPTAMSVNAVKTCPRVRSAPGQLDLLDVDSGRRSVSACSTRAADFLRAALGFAGLPRPSYDRGPASATSLSAWRARAMISNSRGTTRRDGGQPSTRLAWNIRPRARPAPPGSGHPGTRRSGRRGTRYVGHRPNSPRPGSWYARTPTQPSIAGEADTRPVRASDLVV